MSHPVHSITDAPVKHSVEQRQRMVRYTIAMSIRLVCFIAAAVVAIVWETWWAMVLAGAAAVLPYMAVVSANAGGDRYVAERQSVEGPQRQLSTGYQEPEPRQWWEAEQSQESSPSGSAVIDGEVVHEPGNDPGLQEPGLQKPGVQESGS